MGSPVQIPVEPTTPRPQLGDNVDLRIGRTGTGPVLGTRITLDVSGLDGVATLTTGERCTTAAKVITCDVGYLDSDDVNTTARLWLSALPGVRPGASGTVHATISAPDAESASTDFTVEVGTAAFRTKELTPKTGAAIGSRIDPGLRFANRGGVPASRAVVEVYLAPGLKVDAWPSNCEYATAPGEPRPEGTGAYAPVTYGLCTVEGGIAPDEAVRLAGLDLTVAADAYDTFAGFTVLPRPDAADANGPALRKRLTFKHGTGAPATLVKAGTEGIPAGFPGRNDNSTEQEVSADSHADFGVTGTWAPDATGRAGTLTVTAANDGPASIIDRSGGEATPHLDVQLPAGATVTGLPKGCTAEDRVLGRPSEKPLNRFGCEAFDSYMADGAKASFKLALKLAEGTDPLTATVSLQNMGSELEEGLPSALMRWDRNPADNLVKVTLRAAPAPAPTTPPPAPAATTPPAVVVAVAAPAVTAAPSAPAARATAVTVTAGGELADTGSPAAVPLAWASAAALALGTGAVLAARRPGRRRA
ncbi:hypothetical protein ACFVYP_01075 [Kitasatospora sp. NPDC058201]|uniref:hypothetical protein n=1 Tax=unclassified Kitasatospora TaxID=2633591 RepID=UPI003647897A